jgi:ribosome maturation protein Sdo1
MLQKRLKEYRMNEEFHTYNVWLSKGRVVKEGQKGKKSSDGAVLFSKKQTEEREGAEFILSDGEWDLIRKLRAKKLDQNEKLFIRNISRNKTTLSEDQYDWLKMLFRKYLRT